MSTFVFQAWQLVGTRDDYDTTPVQLVIRTRSAAAYFRYDFPEPAEAGRLSRVELILGKYPLDQMTLVRGPDEGLVHVGVDRTDLYLADAQDDLTGQHFQVMFIAFVGGLAVVSLDETPGFTAALADRMVFGPDASVRDLEWNDGASRNYQIAVAPVASVVAHLDAPGLLEGGPHDDSLTGSARAPTSGPTRPRRALPTGSGAARATTRWAGPEATTR